MERWTEPWWQEFFARTTSGPWRLCFSDPVSRRFDALNRLPQPPDWQPLKDLLVRLQREGVPDGATQIRAPKPIYRLSAGEFTLQAIVYPDQKLISIERLQHPLVPSRA